MMIILMLSPNTRLTPTIPPPCTPMPKSDIYPAAPAPHHASYSPTHHKKKKNRKRDKSQTKVLTVFTRRSSIYLYFILAG